METQQATPSVTVTSTKQATPSVIVSLPHFWVGLLFAVIPFVLILLVPTGPEYKHVEEVHFYHNPQYGYIQETKDITPPHPYAPYAAICVMIGWAYWLYCIYRTHRALAKATNGAHPISPGAAVWFHLIPLYNLYWVFKWPNEMAKTVYNYSYQFMRGTLDGVFLLVALVIVYAGLLPPSAVLAHALALAIAVLVGISASRRVHAMIMNPLGETHY